MLTPISRCNIFHLSPMADQFIAEMQQSYASGLNLEHRQDVAELRRLYDHQKPFKSRNLIIDGHCVIAYAADCLNTYKISLPLALQAFLETLGIQQLFLLDFVKSNLFDFPFESFHKRNRFKRMGVVNNLNMGYLMHAADLNKVLPLFYDARKWDVPLIFLITAQGDVPLSMRLCDDGNFHLNYEKVHHHRIVNAALQAGLVSGDIELCSEYSVCYLDRF